MVIGNWLVYRSHATVVTHCRLDRHLSLRALVSTHTSIRTSPAWTSTAATGETTGRLEIPHNISLFPSDLSTWRWRHDGLAVDGVAGSLGRRIQPENLRASKSGSGSFGGAVFGKRLPRRPMVGEGEQMELGPVLEPVADFREKLLFISGLYNEQALKGNIHSSQTGNLLSGAPWQMAARFAAAPASTKSSLSSTGGRRKCRAWCSVASGRIPGFTRTTRCSTVRISPGVLRPP